MKLQLTGGDCSVAAIQNALLVIGGPRPSYARVREAVFGDRPTDDGADELDVQHALGELGYTFTEISEDRRRDAMYAIGRWAITFPTLICVDRWEHWVTVAGSCGRRLHLEDSDGDNPYNTAQCGGHWLEPKTLARRWVAAARDRAALRAQERGRGEKAATARYYGIVVLPARLAAVRG